MSVQEVVKDYGTKKLHDLDFEIQMARRRVEIASTQAGYKRKTASGVIYSDLRLAIVLISFVMKFWYDTKTFFPFEVPKEFVDEGLFGTPLSFRYTMMAAFISGIYFLITGLWLMIVIKKDQKGVFYWFMINCFILILCFLALIVIPFTSLGLQGGFFSIFGIFGLLIPSNQVFKVYDCDRAMDTVRRENIQRKALIRQFNALCTES